MNQALQGNLWGKMNPETLVNILLHSNIFKSSAQVFTEFDRGDITR